MKGCLSLRYPSANSIRSSNPAHWWLRLTASCSEHHTNSTGLLSGDHEGKGCNRTRPPESSRYFSTRLLAWLESLSVARCWKRLLAGIFGLVVLVVWKRFLSDDKDQSAPEILTGAPEETWTKSGFMSGQEFEQFMADLFRTAGYKVDVVG